jgi:hypothetical protein
LKPTEVVFGFGVKRAKARLSASICRSRQILNKRRKFNTVLTKP